MIRLLHVVSFSLADILSSRYVDHRACVPDRIEDAEVLVAEVILQVISVVARFRITAEQPEQAHPICGFKRSDIPPAELASVLEFDGYPVSRGYRTFGGEGDRACFIIHVIIFLSAPFEEDAVEVNLLAAGHDVYAAFPEKIGPLFARFAGEGHRSELAPFESVNPAQFISVGFVPQAYPLCLDVVLAQYIACITQPELEAPLFGREVCFVDLTHLFGKIGILSYISVLKDTPHGEPAGRDSRNLDVSRLIEAHITSLREREGEVFRSSQSEASRFLPF